MHLFIMCQSGGVKMPIKPEKYNPTLYHYNMSYEEYEKVPKLAVAYYKHYENTEFPGIIKEPVFMISNELKKLVLLYDEEILCRGLQIYDDRLEESNIQSHLYWTMGVKEYDCIHDEVRFLPNGSLDKLILDKKKIPQKDIFKVSGIFEERIIVSEAVVESILRRYIYGIDFEEVTIK